MKRSFISLSSLSLFAALVAGCAQTPNATKPAVAQNAKAGNAQDAAYTPPTFRGDKASFTVGTTVAAPAAPRVGFNLEPELFLPWNEEPQFNIWNAWGAFEPASVRARSGVSSGDATSLTVAAGEGNTGGLNLYNQLKGNFWDGGTATVYRLEGGKFRVLRQGVIKSSRMGTGGRLPNAPDVITFAESGPAPRAGDEVLLSILKTEFPGEQVRPLEKDSAFDFMSLNRKSKGAQSLDTSSRAPEGGSTASLRTQFEGAGSVEQQWLNNTEGWARLHEGKPYVWRCWLRQSGVPDGKVKVELGSLASQTLDVTGDWKLYEIEFVGAPPQKKSEPIALSVSGAGTLWADNMAVYEKSLPIGAAYPDEVAKMKTVDPGVLRIWSLQNNTAFGVSLDAALGGLWNAPAQFIGKRIEPKDPVGLHQMLELSAQTGADPWIICSTRMTPEEQANLIEYLAGPATSPYGKKRADMGRTQPWTATFGKIYLEMGNEVWNNSFKMQGFSGEPERYGAYAQMMFEAMQKSPYFDAAKMPFVVNGWANQADGYGVKAAQTAPSARYFDLAPYLGGGWDVGGEFAGDVTQEYGLFNRRNYGDKLLAAHQAAQQLSKGRAQPLGIALYESGPGYSLPGPNKPVDAAEQARGKSLGVALAYFDQVLQARELGFGPVAFFHYGKGDYWTTHAEDGRPHAVWLGMELLNKRASGPMLQVATEQTVLADLAPTTQTRTAAGGKVTTKPIAGVKGAPAVQLHAFRDGDKFSLVMLSLRPDGETPVAVKLPFTPAGEVTVETLNGPSLGSTNLEKDEVKVASATRKIGGNFDYTLPPHSMVVVSGTVAP